MADFFMGDIQNPSIIKKLDLYFFAVSKEEVLRKDYKRVIEIFEIFKKAGKHGKNKLLLNIDGYNDDSRELYMIPEVRDFIQGIWKECKFFLYFVSDIGGTRDVFVACLNEYISHRYVNMNEISLEVNYNKLVMQETVKAIIKYGMQVNDYDGALKIAKSIVN